MAENKRQHYVPKFYLRQFSPDGKNIWIFNISKNLAFYGPLRTMCSESYFYGNNAEVEKSLGPLENKASDVIRTVISSKKLPDLFLERFYLLICMMLQRGRTAAARDAAKLQTKLLSDAITKAMNVSDFKLEWKSDHKFSMLVNFISVPLIADLELVLLINKTKKQFISSDNPVIFYNTKFNYLKRIGTTGFSSRGLQIIWPLNSELALFLYDPLCYEVSQESGHRLILSSEVDVDALNTLQCLYCREILLINIEDNEEYARNLIDGIKQLRSKNTGTTEIIPHPTKPNVDVLHFFHKSHDYALDLSFIRIKDGVEYGIRSQEAIDGHKKFLDDILRGKGLPIRE
jgi:hypothetical protein